MQNAIGRILTAEEVQSFKDGTQIWIETNIPSRNVFRGIKEGTSIKNLEGNRKFSVIDVGSLCVAKEWLYKESVKEMIVKNYILSEDSTVEDDEREIIILKGTKVSSKYDIDENNGLRVTIDEGIHKDTEFIFSMIELEEVQ